MNFIYFQTQIGIFAGYRGSAGQIFFTLHVEKPLKKVATYTPTHVPFTTKTGHFRQSCKGKPCLRMAWRLLGMNVVMTGAVDEFLKGF